jgi:RNA polymerase sigma factor (sigma-70 family)
MTDRGAMSRRGVVPLPLTEHLEVSFSRLYARQYTPLLRYAKALVGEEDASDVVHDAMLKYLRRLQGGYGAHRELEQQELFGLLYDKARDHLRSREKRSDFLQLITGPRAAVRRWMNPARRTRDREIQRHVTEALEELRGSWRDVFVLVRQQGKEIAVAAAILGIKPSTARAHLVRATEALRDRLSAAGITPSHVVEVQEGL